MVHYSGLTRLLRQTVMFAPLCLIGRHSLPVFATGAILCTIGLTIMEESRAGMPYNLVALVGGLALHYLVASYLSKRSEHRRRSRMAIAAARQAASAGRADDWQAQPRMNVG